MPDNEVGPSRAGRRVTIADVAEQAGVSPGAVSFALNDRPGVAPDTRRRILDIATDLGWQPSHRARSLSRSKSFTLGLVIARTAASVGADPFFPAFVAGLNSVLVPQDQSLLFTVVADHSAEVATYRRLAGEQRVDGLFLTDLLVGDPRPALVAELGLPAVTLGRPDADGADPAIGSVSVDDVPGVREVVDELIRVGHRHIAHVTGPEEYLHVRHRRDAWSLSLEAAGLPRGRCLHTDFSAGEGARATEVLLHSRPRPTAIVYANDVMAIAGLAVMQRCGIAVPRDMSITGFDDTDLAHHVHPPLTSVRTDVSGWGERAATALLASIAGAAPQHIELAPARMVARDSVAPPQPTKKGSRR
jgi:DNA-binding LacI/PurR family transcriptional regulator